MHSLYYFTLFFLFGLCSLVKSDHSHSKHDHHVIDHPTKVFGEGTGGLTSDDEELLQANLQSQFSWSDPALVAHLWGGAEKVPKLSRNMPSSIMGESHREERGLTKRAYKRL